MTPERWRQIEDIFQEALDLAPTERAQFIDEKCASDDDLRREVEKLVNRYEAEDSFLESPVWTDSQFLHSNVKRELADSLDKDLPAERGSSLVGERIGVYQLIKELGKGGMGIVFLAARADGEFQQKVAVKLIRRGMDTDFIVKRFRHERQILANLNHPNIARLLDGGTTGDGSPYFIMEYIEGEPINKFCESRAFDLRQKLELFLQACAAIAYAHKQKIIHRDIKPSNILVTDDGIPKLLDFGIAKILDADAIHESIAPTATAMRLMTPEYASPEQARGEEITPASDQYSLGVLLYELLTGSRPYKFPSRAPHEIARIICEEMPSEPSSGEFGKKITGESGGGNLSLAADFYRKIDRIVLKALRKDPAERYSSIEEFAADINRFLRNESVLAESFAEPTTGGDSNSSEKRSAEQSPKEKLYPASSSSPAATATANQNSIAVLPFKILNAFSGNDTDGSDFLSVGLADALITRLSNVRQFVVRPTSAVLRFSQTDGGDSFAAGHELNVNFVLDGNILRADKQIRISVQLLDVKTRSTVWAQRFDEDFTDVLGLEDSISARVAKSLVPKLSTGEAQTLAKRATDKPKAYEAYLRGRAAWNTFSEEGFSRAISFYRQAIEIDPNFALGFAGIADYYIWLGVYNVLPTAEFYPAAKEAALRAIALDPKLSEAYAALGLARLYGEYDWQQSENDLRRAIELSPNNAVAHLWYSHNLYSQGRFAEGTAEVEAALGIDPVSFQIHNTLAWSYYFSRDFEKALRQTDRLIKLFPDVSHGYSSRGCFLNFVGRTDEAMTMMRRAVELSKNDNFARQYEIAQTLAAAGKAAEAKEIINKNRLLTEPGKRFSEFQKAVISSYLKDRDAALGFLESAFAASESLLIWVGIEPSLDYLRDDLRYFNLLEKMHHPLAEKQAKKLRIAEKAQSASPEISENALPIETKKGGFRAVLKYALAAAALMIFGLLLHNIVTHTTISFSSSPMQPGESWRNTFAAQMNVKRLTSSGTAINSAISPDGNKIAFSAKEADMQSLWIRQTDSEKAFQVVAPGFENFVGLTFSPQGEYVYYTTFNPANAAWTLCRVASDGASAPQKMLSEVISKIDFAPDGKRFAYFHLDSRTNTMSLLFSELNEDGTIQTPQQSVTRRLESSYFTGNPAFSPDGKNIVYAAVSLIEQKEVAGLFTVNLETRTEERLGATRFNRLTGIAWRENNAEIVVSGNRKNTEPLQLLLVAYPSGEISRLTNDLNDYSGVSLTKDSAVLVTSKKNVESGISIIDLNPSKTLTETAARQLTGGEGSSGGDRQDGMKGVNWSGDGRIVFISGAGNEHAVTIMNADGTNRQTFNPGGDVLPANPLLTSDGRFLFFIDEKDQESVIRRFEPATGATVQINSSLSLTPTLTPDNRFIVYSTVNTAYKTTLHRISIDGGEATQLTDGACVSPAVSPDGRLIACYYNTEQFSGKWKLAVFNSDGGATLRILETPDTINLQNPHERPLGWSEDNRFVYYLNDKGGVSNIYRVKVEGDNNPPQPMTRFSAGRIFDFSISPDGKKAAMTRGSTFSDVVIFKNSD